MISALPPEACIQESRNRLFFSLIKCQKLGRILLMTASVPRIGVVRGALRTSTIQDCFECAQCRHGISLTVSESEILHRACMLNVYCILENSSLTYHFNCYFFNCKQPGAACSYRLRTLACCTWKECMCVLLSTSSTTALEHRPNRTGLDTLPPCYLRSTSHLRQRDSPIANCPHLWLWCPQPVLRT